MISLTGSGLASVWLLQAATRSLAVTVLGTCQSVHIERGLFCKACVGSTNLPTELRMLRNNRDALRAPGLLGAWQRTLATARARWRADWEAGYAVLTQRPRSISTGQPPSTRSILTIPPKQRLCPTESPASGKFREGLQQPERSSHKQGGSCQRRTHLRNSHFQR